MMDIVYSQHAREKMDQRNTTEDEVSAAIEFGDREPAKKGRAMFRRNFPFNREWGGAFFRTKQVAPVVVEDGATLVVVTVYVFYF